MGDSSNFEIESRAAVGLSWTLLLEHEVLQWNVIMTSLETIIRFFMANENHLEPKWTQEPSFVWTKLIFVFLDMQVSLAPTYVSPSVGPYVCWSVRLLVRPSVGPSVRWSIRPLVRWSARRSVHPALFSNIENRGFWVWKIFWCLNNNVTMSDDEVVASYGPPRSLFHQKSLGADQ